MRSALRTAIACLLTVALVALFLRNADFGKVWDAIGSARMDLIALAVLMTLATYVVRTRRWQYLLEPLGTTRFGMVFRATIIGFAASAVLPAKIGEFVRPYLLARREGLSATATFATILLERMLDLVAVLLLLAAYLVWFDPGMSVRDSALFSTIRLGGLVMTPIALGVLIVMFLLARDPARSEAWLRVGDRWLPARVASLLSKVVRRMSEGFGLLRRPERLLASLGWSVVMWLIIGAETWVVAAAFGIARPFTGAWLMTALLVVGVAVPVPGGVGAFHEAFRLGATAFFGAANDAAIGAAIVLHATSFAPVTILGLYYAAREGLNVKGMKQMTREPVEIEAGA